MLRVFFQKNKKHCQGKKGTNDFATKKSLRTCLPYNQSVMMLYMILYYEKWPSKIAWALIPGIFKYVTLYDKRNFTDVIKLKS